MQAEKPGQELSSFTHVFKLGLLQLQLEDDARLAARRTPLKKDTAEIQRIVKAFFDDSKTQNDLIKDVFENNPTGKDFDILANCLKVHAVENQTLACLFSDLETVSWKKYIEQELQKRLPEWQARGALQATWRDTIRSFLGENDTKLKARYLDVKDDPSYDHDQFVKAIVDKARTDIADSLGGSQYFKDGEAEFVEQEVKWQVRSRIMTWNK